MSKNLSDIERQYFVSKAGGASPQEPLGQLKRRYFSDFVNGNGNESFSELESAWQNKVITDNGGTPNSAYSADLWKQMLIAIGIAPKNTVSENKRLFYINDL